jgi:hypothetical protein
MKKITLILFGALLVCNKLDAQILIKKPTNLKYLTEKTNELGLHEFVFDKNGGLKDKDLDLANCSTKEIDDILINIYLFRKKFEELRLKIKKGVTMQELYNLLYIEYKDINIAQNDLKADFEYYLNHKQDFLIFSPKSTRSLYIITHNTAEQRANYKDYEILNKADLVAKK